MLVRETVVIYDMNTYNPDLSIVFVPLVRDVDGKVDKIHGYCFVDSKTLPSTMNVVPYVHSLLADDPLRKTQPIHMPVHLHNAYLGKQIGVLDEDVHERLVAEYPDLKIEGFNGGRFMIAHDSREAMSPPTCVSLTFVNSETLAQKFKVSEKPVVSSTVEDWVNKLGHNVSLDMSSPRVSFFIKQGLITPREVNIDPQSIDSFGEHY